MEWLKEWVMCACYGVVGGAFALAIGLDWPIAAIIVFDVALAAAIFLFFQWLRHG